MALHGVAPILITQDLFEGDSLEVLSAFLMALNGLLDSRSGNYKSVEKRHRRLGI